jgi:flavodoxin
MKTVIIYYSLTGFTASIAEAMAKVLQADIIELKTSDDLKKESNLKALIKGGSQVFLKKKPALLEFQLNPEDYDLIIIGTPVWAWSYAPPLRSFFADYTLAGKKVAVYATHQGGPGKTLKNMTAELPEANVIAERDFINEKNKHARAFSNARLWAAALIKENH